MWPFIARGIDTIARIFRGKKASPFKGPIRYMQVDITERFDDDLGLEPDDWIETTTLNRDDPDPESVGLPPLGADDEEVYRIAAAMSVIRQRVPPQYRDGVYCPICHIANIDRGKVRTPCPKCGRELLQFGWT
jgi:hypothetical protein